MKKLSRYQKILVIGFGIIVFFNLLGFIKLFDDLYTDYVYWILADGIGFITNLFPFALGEICMYLGVLAALLAIALGPVLLIFRKKQKVKGFAKVYYKAISIVILVLLMLYTFCWTIPFRAHELSVGENAPKDYSISYVGELRDEIVRKLNETAISIKRDETGRPVQGNVKEDVVKAMKNHSDEFGRLSGFYPRMKVALCSDFLEYMNIGGYTYPFTMEMTNNKYTASIYYPVLYAHEAAHHKGYYKESEAVFLSCVTLLDSDNEFLRYSALFELYYYMDDAYWKAVPEDIIEDAIDNSEAWSELVTNDWVTAMLDVQNIYEENSHPFENMQEFVEDVGDTGWEIQEDVLTDEDTNYSYDGCIKLFLAYWYDKKF